MPKYWMITNRNVIGQNTDLGNQRSDLLHFYTLDESRAKASDHGESLTHWSEQSAHNFRKALEAAADKFPLIDEDFHEKQKHVTLFIHGYNNTWIESFKRYKQITHDLYGKDDLGICVLFTWPSNGKTTHYLADRSDARASGADLAKVLSSFYEHGLLMQQKAAEGGAICKAKVSIIAHSMGTITITLGDSTKPKAILKLKARVLGTFDQPQKINVALESISLVLNESATIQRKTAPRRAQSRSRGCRNYAESVTISVKQWLETSKISQLGLSISAAGQTRTETPPFDPSDTILRVQGWDLLGGVQIKQEGANGRQLLPFSLALTLNSDATKIDQLKPLLDQSLQLAVAAEAVPKATAEKITKAAPSVLGFLSKLSIDDLALIDFNGYILLLPSGATPPVSDSANRLNATTTDDQVWSARLQKPVEWRGQAIGTLDVALSFSRA